ncbi:MAG: hypothetical protein WBL19_00495 [Minisyncoccia bacterium]
MDVIKVILPTVLSFFIGLAVTPFFTRFFHRYRLWKKLPRTEEETNKAFSDLHDPENETRTPRLGGVIIWVAVFLAISLIYLISGFFPSELTEKLNFLSRSQTLVPLGAFFFAALLGLLDDLIQISGKGATYEHDVLYRKVKIAFVTLIGVVVGWWFYFKIDFSSVHIPFWGDLELGLLFIPFFILVMLATFSTSVIDGIDGLAGGVLVPIFTAFAAIALINNQIDISALSGAIAGGILAFLWFNVPPARFYMGETGMMALTVVLSVIAFLTNSVLLLPIIALPLVATSLSVIIQIVGFKFFGGRRVFRVSPLHHHFQALGWSKERIVMRYWIVSFVSALTGVIIALVS